MTPQVSALAGGGLLALFGAAIYVILSTIHRVLPERIKCHAIYARLQPLYPLVVGGLLAPLVAPGRVEGVPVTMTMAALSGAFAGAIGSTLYQIVKQTIRGYDKRIRT
jgi:hypothetical protein